MKLSILGQRGRVSLSLWLICTAIDTDCEVGCEFPSSSVGGEDCFCTPPACAMGFVTSVTGTLAHCFRVLALGMHGQADSASMNSADG